MVEIVLASANPHKVAEIEAILREELDATFILHARPSEIPDIEETGSTLIDNARLKAEAICAATGRISVADDTGLFVEALHGDPGVYSARYAGEHASYSDNVKKLLSALGDDQDRQATFRTVAIAVFPGGRELVAVGEVAGTIASAPRGHGGFGYDPVFVPDELDGRTFAELTAWEKHDISHRGRAFRALARELVVVDIA